MVFRLEPEVGHDLILTDGGSSVPKRVESNECFRRSLEVAGPDP